MCDKRVGNNKNCYHSVAEISVQQEQLLYPSCNYRTKYSCNYSSLNDCLTLYTFPSPSSVIMLLHDHTFAELLNRAIGQDLHDTNTPATCIHALGS